MIVFKHSIKVLLLFFFLFSVEIFAQVNGGFELDNTDSFFTPAEPPTGWRVNQIDADANYVFRIDTEERTGGGGAQSFRCDYVASTKTLGIRNNINGSAIDAPVNSIIILRFWAKGLQGDEKIDMQWRKENDSEVLSKNTTLLSDEWQLYTYEYQSLEDASYGVLFKFNAVQNANRSIWIDDVHFELKKELEVDGKSIYVSNEGNDDNDGTLSNPYQSIAKAAEMLGVGDTIYIMKGIYSEEVKLNNIQGTFSNPVVIKPYEDDTVVLDGTIAIESNWTLHEGNIYKTKVDQPVWQLFVDGRMQIVARWPNVDVSIKGNHPCDSMLTKENRWEPVDGSWWSRETTWARERKEDYQYGVTNIDPSYHDLSLVNMSFEGGSGILNYGSFYTYERKINAHEAGTNTFTYDAPINDQHYDENSDGRGWFFIEHFKALDIAEEWYYDKTDSMVYLYADDGKNPNGRNIRAKYQSFAFELNHCKYIKIDGFNFYGTSFKAGDSNRNITVSNCSLSYPSFSPRLLGKYDTGTSLQHDYTTTLSGDSMLFYNNSVEFTEGHGLDGQNMTNSVVENNYFKHIDFTGLGQFALNLSGPIQGVNNCKFSRNTIYVSGVSAATLTRSGEKSYNRISHFGYLQDDGGAYQSVAPYGRDRHHNWTHDTRKFSLRYDGNPAGEGGLDHHNVQWNTWVMRLKGDKHEIISNTTIFPAVTPNIGQGGINIATDKHPTGNQNSITVNNAAQKMITTWDCGAMIPGTQSNNWNGCWNDLQLEDELRDPRNLDFRPKATSTLVDGGIHVQSKNPASFGAQLTKMAVDAPELNSLRTPNELEPGTPDIGAYEYGSSEYWIAGAKLKKASTPIPVDGTKTAKVKTDLMYLIGLDCVSADILIGTSKDNLTKLTNLSDPNNVVTPSEYGFEIQADNTYYWRVDGIKNNGLRVIGDVWSFTTEVSSSIGNNISTNDLFSLYPNPTTGLVNLTSESGEMEISVFAMNGTIVYDTKIVNDQQLDLSHLLNGIYLVKVVLNNKVAVERLVIRR